MLYHSDDSNDNISVQNTKVKKTLKDKDDNRNDSHIDEKTKVVKPKNDPKKTIKEIFLNELV